MPAVRRRRGRTPPRRSRGRARQAREHGAARRGHRPAAGAPRRPRPQDVRLPLRPAPDRPVPGGQGDGHRQPAAGRRRDRRDGHAARDAPRRRGAPAPGDAAPHRLHRRRPARRTAGPHLPGAPHRPALLRHERGAASAHPPARLRLPDPARRPLARELDGDEPPAARPQRAAGVPRDRRPEPRRHPGPAALAERDAVQGQPRPAVLRPRRRRARLDALPLAHVDGCRCPGGSWRSAGTCTAAAGG